MDIYFAADLSAQCSMLVTNSERHFTWDEFGLNIHIPEKSLPEGVQLVRVHIRSAITGDFQLPHDTHLVSAV